MKNVAVVGGGIAGLTAALRLAERGHQVTLYERRKELGGNLAARPGTLVDIYPHMYLNWYHNFWRLLDDVGAGDRDELFAPMSSVRFLEKGSGRCTALTDTFAPWSGIRNMFSGVAPPADMFLFMYASVDLLARRLDPGVLLDDVSLNGFLQGRPYMTARAAELFNYWVTLVWAIPSFVTSAADYRTFLKHGYTEPVPAYWSLRRTAQESFLAPIERALVDAGVTIRQSTEVTEVWCDGRRVRGISWRTRGRGAGKGSEQVDDLVLAVPPSALTELIRKGDAGRRVVDAEPDLAAVARLRTEPIPMLYLHFTRKLRDIPPGPVGLVGSRYGLAFTDVATTAPPTVRPHETTFLALSASDRWGLPGTEDESGDAIAMVRELGRYVDFEVPATWRGHSRDIDWRHTSFDRTEGVRLFINETGTESGRPGTTCAVLENLHLAGDFCRNDIGMTCIEAAVVTGLNAARSVVDRWGGAPVDIVAPKDLPPLLFAWLRSVWAPYAAAATTWSKGSDLLRDIRREFRPQR